MRVTMTVLLMVLLGAAACRKGPDHHVVCTQAKIRRADANKGTPNDRQSRCHGLVEEYMKKAPDANHAAYADCVLDAPDETALSKCKAP